jgi:UDP-GlcNAc:undecaprenyl-phosphate GlcNAc-1-phosphate transferase
VVSIGWLAIPISIVWLVGVTNAFNIIDGLDGLAAGLALISAVSLAAVAIVVGRFGMATAALVLAGAIVGFLPFNFHPAKMFMGDSGSATIGFFLACLALRGGSTISAGLAILLPIVVLGLPLAETLVSMARRFLRKLDDGSGKGMFAADRGHFHHRLLDLGLKHHHAVLLLYGVGLLLAALGLASLLLTAKYAAILLLTLLVAAFIGVGRLGYEEFALVRRGIALKVYDTVILRSTIFVVFVDLALLVVAIYGAIVLKYDDWGIKATRMLARDLVVFVPASAVVVFWTFKLYRGSWKLASIEDFVRCSAAVIVAGVTGFTLAIVAGSTHVPVTLGLTFTILALLAVNGARLSYRVLSVWTQRSASRGLPVLIYGAGVGGAMALRELLSNQEQGMKPVGFIDDDPRKKGRLIQGLPIFGSLEDARELLESGEARGVIVSSEKLQRERIHELRNLCRETGAKLSYFLIDFHHVAEFEFSVTEAGEAPTLPIRKRRTESAELRIALELEKRAAQDA